jgi:hypothetical protein
MVFFGGGGLGGARWDIQVRGFGGCCPEQVGDIEVHFWEYHDRSNKSNLRIQLSKLYVENVPEMKKTLRAGLRRPLVNFHFI